jgi:hypothetical protein
MHIITAGNFNFKKAVVLFFFFTLCVCLRAQTIKYVTFFPTPHTYYTSISAKTALLGTRGEVKYVKQNISPSGRIVIGNETTAMPVLSVNTFKSADLILKPRSHFGKSDLNLHVGYYDSASLPADSNEYTGSLNVFNVSRIASGNKVEDLSVNVDMRGPVDNMNAIKAHNELRVVGGIYWEGFGGFGMDKNGHTKWGYNYVDISVCDDASPCCYLVNKNAKLTWIALKIAGTDSVQTYLACCDGNNTDSGACSW